jgi:hypothetical protein
MGRAQVVPWVLGPALLLLQGLAHAQSAGTLPLAAAQPSAPSGSEAGLDAADQRALRRFARPAGGYVRLLGGAAVGTGLRFNNPYRLQTQLGDDAESVALTAGYLDLAIAMCFGPPDGLQHGASIHLSVALAGIGQQIVTPSYLVVYRGPHPWMGYGRLGPAYVVSPDENIGTELGLGAAYFVTASVGISAELVGDLFYGAGTRDVAVAVYPILSGQLGITVDYEVLP